MKTKKTKRLLVIVGAIALSLGFAQPRTAHAQNLYVASYNNNQIRKYGPTGDPGTTFTGLGDPTGLAFDTVGNLYVANYNNIIEKYGPGGGAGTVFANAGLSNPTGLAFDAAGNLYVANFGNSTIEKYGPGGGAGTTFATEGPDNDPEGLAFDTAGNLYVANYGSGVEEYGPGGGAGTLFAGNGLDGPSALAFDNTSLPIPEPSTWLGGALMLATAFLTLRRRLRRM